MKTLIFSLLLIVTIGVGQAQEIQLEEAKVGFAPLEAKITKDGDRFSYLVNENYAGEFTKDAVGFMKANFDIQYFINEYGGDYNHYQVTFTSGKGTLTADFDEKGVLLSTHQKFKDIALPLDIRREAYMANQGWTMTQNKYIASGSGDILENEVYKIKLENGNKKRSMKINPREVGRTSVVSN